MMKKVFIAMMAAMLLTLTGCSVGERQEQGLLTRIGYQPTAAHPRQFNITPNGQYLLCCCRDSDKIQVFHRDIETGMLTDTHKDIRVSRAVCVQFFNNQQ